MKKKKLYAVTTILFVVGLCFLYYFYPRNVHFKLAKEIEKPSPEFDNYHYKSFEYADSKDRLIYWLAKHYKSFYPQEQIYDSLFAENLANNFDFTRYDYIIAYQKKIKKLRHSPYLTKTEDDLYFEERTPLIPIWDSVRTDKVYIYRIKKNNKFRRPGP